MAFFISVEIRFEFRLIKKYVCVYWEVNLGTVIKVFYSHITPDLPILCLFLFLVSYSLNNIITSYFCHFSSAASNKWIINMVWMLQYTFSFLVTVHVIYSALVSRLLGDFVNDIVFIISQLCVLRSLCTVKGNKCRKW